MVDKLTDQELEQYSRQISLNNFSVETQEQLKNAKVAIVGVGGLGSNNAMLLASMGVGTLRLIDRDVVELSNLPRTPLYNQCDLEKSKAEVAGYRIQAINPNVKVEIHTSDFNGNNARDLLKGVDVVVDGLDRFGPRWFVNRTCKTLGLPYVFAGVVGTAANLTTFTYDKSPCLSCIFREVNDTDLPTCESVGVHTSAVMIATSIQVSETIRLLTGDLPILEGKLLYIELDTLSFNQIQIMPQEDCEVCRASSKTCPVEKQTVVELCGKNSYIIPSPANIQINIRKVKEILEQEFTISAVGNFALTFQRKNIKISLMAGGNALVRGATGPEDAKAFYNEVMRLISSHVKKQG